MTNEIKEILEALKSHDKVFTETDIKEYPLTLSIEEQKVLLDYITNLQEKIFYLKNAIICENKSNVGRINKAIQLIEKQKRKMYKSRNKIAMYILMNLENILRGDE